MKKICLITNYNYEQFVLDSIASAINQTVQFDQILVIDDGSTDKSVSLIENTYGRHELIKFIKKENRGQLSCFNLAVEQISSEDLVFFLDADDVYPSNYVEMVLSYYEEKDDFLFATTIKFNAKSLPIASSRISEESAIVFRSSSHVTKLSKCWIGSETSALVLRGYVLKKLLPYPFIHDWRARADDVLVFGASILGFKKKFLPGCAVAYRVHGANHYHGTVINQKIEYQRTLDIDKMFRYICARNYDFSKPSFVLAVIERSLILKHLRDRFYIPHPIRLFYMTYLNSLGCLFKSIFSTKYD